MFTSADTSALVALSSIGRLDLLRHVAPEVWVPPAVVEELIENGVGWRNARQAQDEFAKGQWLLPWTKDFPRFPIGSRKLGRGEVEAVSLAHFFTGRCFIDERRGRSLAAAHHVPIFGAPGVLCRCKHEGFLTRVKPLLDAMVSNGIFYDSILIAKVLDEVNE